MSMDTYEKQITSLTDTPFGYTLSMIGGKWRLVILYWLVDYPVIRFNELQRKIGTITYKTLSAELKAMEADGTYHSQGISPNSAQSGIQSFRKRTLSLPSYGKNV